MSQMTTSQARLVDPILSTHAQGYTPAESTGHVLFPVANVPARGAQILKFGKEDFRLVNARRAPAGATKRVQYGYTAGPISVVQDALEAVVADELRQEAALSIPNFDLARGSVEMVLNQIGIIKDVSRANLATNPATYPAGNTEALAGADKWTDPASDPEAQVNDYREVIRRSIGRYPNTMRLSPDAFAALKKHPKIVERYKYTSAKSITAEMLAQYFGLATVSVDEGVYLPTDADDGDAMVDITSNAAILAYVAGGSNWMVPSFGYTYRLTGYPMVEPPYRDSNHKCWVYPVTDEWQAVVTGPDAGFLIQTPV